MAIRFIETDPDTGDGYNIDDSTGDVFDTSGNQLDPSTALTPDEQTQLNNDNLVGNVTDENQADAETRRLAGMNSGERGLGNITVGSETADSSTWAKIAAALGLKDTDGSLNLKKILALTGAGLGVAGALTDKPQTQRSIADLRAGMPGQSAMNTTGWTPEQLAFGQRPMQTGSALQRVYAADMQSPVTPGKTARQYAEGGDVDIEGPLTQAFAGAVQGDDGGQSDLVDAKLSPGEYVMDAESVSALGDGNTAAGIAKLDELRAQLRAQKRSAPTDSIPPQAAGPLSYMQGA